MGAEAHGQGHKACWPRGRLASRWLHTCRGPVSWPKLGCPPPILWNQASASPRRRRELLTKSRRHVATRDSRGHVERNVEHIAAVRMVALGCAHDQGMGRSCACGGGIQHTRNICHGVALNYGWKFPLNRGWNHKGMARGNKGGVDFFSSAAQTAAWGRLVGRHRVHVRS